MDKTIIVNNVSKIYRLYDKRIDRLKEALNITRKNYHKEFYALKNISFSISKGESLGIIGKNGSGKSTLLKIITGVLTQTSGDIKVNGKISALLELGAGFNFDYTGMENIYLNGTIMGYSKEEIDEKLNDIISFADIGDYINQPVKYYSSGMFVRLAFAVAINVDPDILIVDEALSVGDIRFQQKCYRKIEELKKDKTVIFVSHDIGAVTKYCDRAIWINEGELLAEGRPKDIVKQYRAFMTDSKLVKFKNESDKLEENDKLKTREEKDLDLTLENENMDMHGDCKALIYGIGLFDAETDEKLSVVQPKQQVKLYIKAKIVEKMQNDIIVGFTIRDRLGNIVTQSNNYVLEEEIQPNGDTILSCFQFIIPNIASGVYTISPAIASGTQEEHIQHNWIYDALIVEVINYGNYLLEGYIFLEPIQFSYV